MFIVLLTYKKSLEQVDKHVSEHVKFLEKAYSNNYFIASGCKNPHTGGVILSGLKNRAQLEELIKQDPFYIYEIADYEIVEFIPTKYQDGFEHFID